MKKKVILISGGSDGLGKAIAEKLAWNYRVVIFSPDGKKLKAVSDKYKCDFFVGDVSSPDDIRRIVNSTLKKHKRIDCLINNAGIWIQGELETNETERIKKVLEVNTLGTILLSREVVPIMKKQKGGIILNVISQAGLYGKPLRTVYNASKWAVTGFTKSLEPELSPYGIKVMGIYPGAMKTNLFKRAGDERDLSKAIDPKDAARLVECILSFGPAVMFPEVGIKYIP